MLLGRILDDLVRHEGRRVLASLARLTGNITAAEDALQEAYARALVAWRDDGIPERPAAWLNTVARRIAIDRFRRGATAELPPDLPVAPHELEDPESVEDDRLRLLFVCCHPALSEEARSALALRTLGGLTTREIARAFVEPEATTAQRLVRAKKKIRDAGIPFEVPPREKLPERIDTVLSVLYLIFNEGYASTDAPSLLRPDLVAEAIRLARLAVELMPDVAEARGLLALMLLTDARSAVRIDAGGDLVPLEEQERSRWNREMIEEGMRLLDEALELGAPGPYQTQAAIAALHAAAARAEETDWLQIAALYRTLLRWMPNPVIELNAAVADGMAHGLDRALAAIAGLERRGALATYHLLHAAKADILRRLGRNAEAAAAYRSALALATNPAERRYLERRLTEVT
ncbi:MAG TPA: sigma-70 family RNA polymerase sigma factor [Thermoanaerobaculia bacterium]|nr:sigma-70 family RNA polymerase sigma factor [Thermoanaerobaculia bacterium]